MPRPLDYRVVDGPGPLQGDECDPPDLHQPGLSPETRENIAPWGGREKKRVKIFTFYHHLCFSPAVPNWGPPANPFTTRIQLLFIMMVSAKIRLRTR